MTDNKPVTETDIQIRFADADSLGHINNVNQQHYFDLGKNDFFRKVLGIGTDWKHQGIITAATSTSYFSQTRLQENIFVRTEVEKIGTKSLTVYQQLISRDTSEIKSESRSVMVAFDFASQESIEIPQQWKEPFRGQ